MSNQELKQRVEELIKEVNATHRYSMSRIYGLSNEIFGKNETPQSCASCLLRKVKELEEWLKQQKEEKEETQATDEQSEKKEEVKTPSKRRKKNDPTQA